MNTCLRSVLKTLLLLVLAKSTLLAAIAQTASGQDHNNAAKSTDRSPLAFEVVSIRPSKPGTGPQQIGPTADGYRMRNLFMEFVVVAAYLPTDSGSAHYTDDQLKGFPDWVINDPYDIDAKVSAADLEKWQNPALQPAMLRAMLQNMLADRLKLAVHREVKDGSMYALIVGKGGPKFKETNPKEHHAGFSLPGGGVLDAGEVKDGERITYFYDFSMPMLAASMTGKIGRPVQDRTGLTGRYDIVERTPIPTCAPHCNTSTSDETSASSILGPLGLKLEPTKGKIETLVLDHVERPSEN